MKRKLWVRFCTKTCYILETRKAPFENVKVLDVVKTQDVRLKELYIRANEL